MEVSEPIIKQGKGIVCICITSKFSGSLQSATNAKNILLETYPDAKIEVIDSMVNTVLQGLFVLEAAKMCKAGVPMEACVNELLDREWPETEGGIRQSAGPLCRHIS